MGLDQVELAFTAALAAEDLLDVADDHATDALRAALLLEDLADVRTTIATTASSVH
jgi:hypothetical protein